MRRDWAPSCNELIDELTRTVADVATGDLAIRVEGCGGVLHKIQSVKLHGADGVVVLSSHSPECRLREALSKIRDCTDEPFTALIVDAALGDGGAQ
jgi:hypothetical protein